MSATPPNEPQTEFPPSEGWPDYPGFGSDDDVHARILLLDWLRSQIGVTVRPEPGDWVLATDGRVLGHGPDPDEVYDRVVEAEPALRNARIVQCKVPLWE